ncbi:unnamed protein product [Amoebophrya sp. A25]|nr:unnamed protein product [Amoebophrya sp. A25]|eukprot:GSA25T00015165001.1
MAATSGHHLVTPEALTGCSTIIKELFTTGSSAAYSYSLSSEISTYYYEKDEKTLPYTLKEFKCTLVHGSKIALIVWDMRKTLNAITRTTLWELCFLLEHFRRVESVVALVWVSSSTPKGFCSGANPAGLQSTEVADEVAAGYKHARRGLAEDFPNGRDGSSIDFTLKGPVAIWHEYPKLSICACPGLAIGGGTNAALMVHDFVFVAPDTKFRFPFAELGVTAEVASSYWLPRWVGMARAKEWIMTGKWFTGPECVAAGIATEVVTGPVYALEGHALAYTQALLDTSAKFSTVSLLKNKRLLHASYDATLEPHLTKEQLFFTECLSDRDSMERFSNLMKLAKKRKAEQQQKSKL